MKVFVYNQKGEKSGTAELPDSVFGLKWNSDLVHQVVTSYAANLRRGTAHTKGFGEVRGGGKKPWQQKGTGRARHGSIRSPLWRGGGVTHGPTSGKVYKKNIPKKMARKAFYTALSAKAKDKEIIILDDLQFKELKTKYAAVVFANLSTVFSDLRKGNGVLVALPEDTYKSLRRVFLNIPYVRIELLRNINAFDVLRYRYLLFLSQSLDIFK